MQPLPPEGGPPPAEPVLPGVGTQLQTDWPERPASTPPEKPGRLAFFRELPVLILIAFGLALLIKTFLIQAFYIPSESMEATLLRNDRVLVNKLVYRFREPRRGEIMVFVAERDGRPRSLIRKVTDFLTEGLGVAQPGERDFIKRLIGLPGETLSYRDSVITITRPDGTKLRLREPYAHRDDRPFGPFKVPAGHYFMMGDNRTNSSDSRFSLGPIRRSDIVGKAFIRIWPPGRAKIFTTPPYGPAAAAGTFPAVVAIGLVRRTRRRAVPPRRAA
ncbi:MAG: signal peptidase I [Acidobacteria bacterium]|nr:signal peptidase I [Acidobacteriota bacterium]